MWLWKVFISHKWKGKLDIIISRFYLFNFPFQSTKGMLWCWAEFWTDKCNVWNWVSCGSHRGKFAVIIISIFLINFSLMGFLYFYLIYPVCHGYKLDTILLIKIKPTYNCKNEHDGTNIYWMRTRLINEIIKNFTLFSSCKYSEVLQLFHFVPYKQKRLQKIKRSILYHLGYF